LPAERLGTGSDELSSSDANNTNPVESSAMQEDDLCRHRRQRLEQATLHHLMDFLMVCFSRSCVLEIDLFLFLESLLIIK
jgi:hypothetical protein